MKWYPFPPSVLPLGGTPDMFVRTEDTRALIFVMSNKIDDTLCYSIGSAYLSGLPVVVAGYDMPYHGYLSKFDFLEKAIENLKLKQNEVIIVMDSDTIFTGMDLNPLLDRFVEQSAATPEELDALAVRQGRAMAPFIVSGEIACFAPYVFNNLSECRPGFQVVYNKVRKYAAAHPEHNIPLTFDLSPQHHLNSGVVISRVWAYREFLQKAMNLTKTIKPRTKDKNIWACDQSVYIELYIDLITLEVEKDVFSMPIHLRQAFRSTYGIRAGLMGLDYVNVLAFSGLEAVLFSSQMHNEHWAKYLPLNRLKYSHTQDMTNIVSETRFVNDLYWRTYAAHGKKVYTNRAMPKWVGIKTNRLNVTLAPPLFALRPRPIDVVSNEVRRTFPIIFHAPGVKPGFSKVSLLERGAISAQWLVPMVYDSKEKRHGMEHLASAPLFLSTNSSIIRYSYSAKCGFPYEETIANIKKTLD
ncbi:unnamed protein product [Phytomonas sp. Hart1]|nr:unnamed protein product [Phytomonas sp. Hart1]|eukprot:CCW67252.1 unnamed protein product [Phytomonas sp. isolate Hart1]